MNNANALGIQTYESDVACGMWCQGGSVKFYPTDHPQYTDIADVWVKGSDALELVNRLRAELTEARKPDCFICAYWFACRTDLKNDCSGGDKFTRKRDPVRLYEKEGKV